MSRILLQMTEAEALAHQLIGERARGVPGLEGTPSSPLHPWHWSAPRHRVSLWVRFTPGEVIEADGAMWVRCAPRLDVNLDARPTGSSARQAGDDMDAALRLSRQVQQLALDVVAHLQQHQIVRRVEPYERPTVARRQARR